VTPAGRFMIHSVTDSDPDQVGPARALVGRHHVHDLSHFQVHTLASEPLARHTCQCRTRWSVSHRASDSHAVTVTGGCCHHDCPSPLTDSHAVGC
jgi:hypothetical protein